MKCVFCKEETTADESLEHIIPESLGNPEHVLRAGLVCNKCNNYFASKVEKTFMELPPVVTQRFEQSVPSKKGRVPSNHGLILQGQTPIEAIRDSKDGGLSIGLPDDPSAIANLRTLTRGTLILPTSMPIRPNQVVSRFMAKVAVEAMADRLDRANCVLDEFIDNEQLDQIREHARYGKIVNWPVHIRQVYNANASWSDGSSPPYQIMHEFDFLFLDDGEIYFVLVLFGQEMTINMGGPSIGGWERWLVENDNRSPLHPEPT